MPINRVAVVGNLTHDPEQRQTRNGYPVLNFSIAVNDRRKNGQTGQWEDYANFFDCTMLGKRGESVGQYLSKGTRVAIEGKLHQNTWEKDGERRSKVEIIVDEIEFMSPRQESSYEEEYTDIELPF